MERRSKQQQQQQRHHDTLDLSFSPIVDLFTRIHIQRICIKQNERIKHFKHTFIFLIICILLTYLLQYHNQIYNALAGPFHWDLNQFLDHLHIYNQQLLPSKSHWFSFHQEYFQVELGENQIQMLSKHPFLRLINESTISTSLHPNNLYVKLPTRDESHFHARLPFRFQSFSVGTLKCIGRQLRIPPIDSNTWLDRFMYLRTIEQLYDRNSTKFNENVLINCGILLGYLYRPRGEHSLLQLDYSTYNFHRLDVAIDASYPYYPFKAFFLGGLVLTWLLIKSLGYLFLYLSYRFLRPTLIIHPTVQDQMRQIGVDSLQSLNDLFYDSSLNGQNYHDRLFLVRQQHLVLLNVDLNEHNPRTLSQFCAIQSPLTIVLVSSIIKVSNKGFLVNSENNHTWFNFPMALHSTGDSEASEWLHNHMMAISERYRRCNEEERVRIQQELDARRFASLLAEEEQLEHSNYGNDFNRMWERITSASPRFIAQFRFKQHPLVQNYQMDLLNNDCCAVCLDKFDIGQHYAEWPCPGQHVFHYQCMLEVLRAKNTCPLCRHAVEPAFSPTRDVVFRLMFVQAMTRMAM